MSPWRARRPVIANMHGFAVAGGLDIAPRCALVAMEETAEICDMPACVWGRPTTGM